MKNGALAIACILTVLFSFAGTAALAAGDAAKGREVYDKRCVWCHGEEGDGAGPASDFLIPPPRDFTAATFKFKSTPYDEFLPADEDLFKMIAGGRSNNHITGWTGMSDSSMPGWEGTLTDEDIWNLVELIKTEFGGFEAAEKGSISYSSQIATSEDSIAKGKEIFKELCVECHGKKGRGSGTKKLKDDWGYRTWPRNFTKAWSFRVSNDPKDIFTRASIGIPGTQMPSFADPESDKVLSEEDRWHVANFVASLDEPYKKPGNNTVIKAKRVEEALPTGPDDEVWATAEYTSFYMVGQVVEKERHFSPSINSISVKAMYDDKDIVFLLEWDDRTRSLPGNKKAIEIADGDLFEDAVAVQFPVALATSGSEKPYFGMGDASKPVNILYWRSEDKAGGSQLTKLMNSKGSGDVEDRDAAAAGLTAAGTYDEGTWRVFMKRPLTSADPEKDLSISEGKFVPIAFAAWDGSNQEKGSKHAMTAWYWLFLKPDAGMGVVMWPLSIAFLVFAGELLWLRSARKK